MKRVGIVGCGCISSTHGWALSRMDNVLIAAVSDIDSKRAIKFSQDFANGEAQVFQNYEEMLKKAKLDVVHICTPHNLHAPMSIAAMKKGISVFCEKPAAISINEFERLRNISEENHTAIGFCFQNRYNKTIEETDTLIVGRTLGNVVAARAFVTWRRDAEYYNTPWKGQMETSGGGALINQSIHTLDLLLRYFDEPVTVKASMSNHHLPGIIEVEDTVEAWMEFDGGRRACFYASTAYASDSPVILEFQCEKGSITIIDKVITVKDETGRLSTIVCEEPLGIGKSYWGSGHLSCIKDFYSKLGTGEPFQNDWYGVRKTMNTMMRIYDFR